MSWKGGGTARGSAVPTVLGLGAGATFALSAVGFRGAILSLGAANFVAASTFTLTVGLAMQAAVLSLYLALHERPVLSAIVKSWRPSLFAGAMGHSPPNFGFWRLR